jgi:hypothetical protein
VSHQQAVRLHVRDGVGLFRVRDPRLSVGEVRLLFLLLLIFVMVAVVVIPFHPVGPCWFATIQPNVVVNIVVVVAAVVSNVGR